MVDLTLVVRMCPEVEANRGGVGPNQTGLSFSHVDLRVGYLRAKSLCSALGSLS